MKGKLSIFWILLAALPTVVFTAVGILILVFQRAGFDIVFGVLVLTFAASVLTGTIMLAITIRRQSQASKLQIDFVAKVSHELRTPLASIRMFVDTLEQGGAEDPEERAMCLDVISSETSRLSRMIERLLSWGQMEAGKRLFSMRPERIDTLIGEALEQFEAQRQSFHTTVDLDLPDDVPAVDADREPMVETLLNLLSNALKYGGEMGTITVRARRHKKRVLIDIRDQGPGIARDEQRRIFEKFYRGRASQTGLVSGSGLGLAMAEHVVKAHQGRIRVVSELGQGATFTIDLPALRDSTRALEVPAE